MAAPAAAAKQAAAGPLAQAVVGEGDAEVASGLVELLGRWRIEAQVVTDGAQVLLHLMRKAPDLVVLGSRLGGLSASALCEMVRRTKELAALPIIRIAGLEDPPGAPEFEANHVLQPAAVREGLGPLLARLGVGQEPAPEPAPSAAPAAARGGGAEKAAADPQVAAAERLARIIVSDIILYNEAKFRAAASQGNVTAALEHELGEASALFRQRVPEAVRSGRDFLAEELQLRAAKLRAG